MPVVVNNFRTGEISDRVDRLKAADIVANGALKAKNVVVNMQGGLRKRPGLRWIRRLPTADGTDSPWRRIFAWDKSPEERLTLCYAEDGVFKVLLEDGTLLDVEGRGNVGAGADMQFYNQGNRVIFTDKREPKHILANPRTAGGDAILLTGETAGVGDILRNYAAEKVNNQFPNYDVAAELPSQQFSLTAYDAARKTAMISVEELRSVFTGGVTQSNRVGVFAASDFTNNPQNYNQSPTEIAVVQFNEISVPESGARLMRVTLATALPNWVEKLRVVWDTHTREFAYANSTTFTDTMALNNDEYGDWERSSTPKYAQIIRRAPDTPEQSLPLSTTGFAPVGEHGTGVIAPRNIGVGVSITKASIQKPVTTLPSAQSVNVSTTGVTAYTEQARWNAASSGGVAQGASYQAAGHLWANTGNPASGTFPANTAGNWRLRQVGGASISGVLQRINAVDFRITSATAMRAAFGTVNINSGGQWILEQVAANPHTSGAININSNGVNITQIALPNVGNVLSVTATGINNTKQVVIVAGAQTITFAAGQFSHTLSSAQAAAFRAAASISVSVHTAAGATATNTLTIIGTGLDNQERIVVRFGNTTKELAGGQYTINLTPPEATDFRDADTLYINATPLNVGKESRDADFHALAVERQDGGNYRSVYIKGREFYALNNSGDIARQPFGGYRREVIALMIDDAFKNQPEVILRTFDARVLPLVERVDISRAVTGANLKKLLTVSDFLCFRPPVLNPPLQYYDDEDEYNAEVDRIGRRFCAQTSEATGGSLTSGEYEMEWVATAPVDEWDNQLIAVGGDAMTGGSPTPVANRPELTRRGVTRIFQNSDGDIAEVTGWKYNNDSNSGTPSSLRNTIVNIPGRGGAAGDDPGSPNFDEPDGFADSPIAAKGTLVPRLIETNNGTIGKSPGRWAMIWNEVDGFPATAVQTQSRLAYGGTTTYPARVWMSVIGQPHNFLDFRPVPNEPKSIDARPDFAIDLELDTSAISQMANEAALLIFTQNEAHIANGPFQASNVATKVTRRFGRLGQERNIGVAAIDEHIFVYANGAPYGLLYEAIDVGYKSQNLSAQRNEDIMQNYDDAAIVRDCVKAKVGALTDLSVSGDNGDLRPVRVVATQPKGLNGAYLVLFLLSDGSVRAFHTLHREEFFAWSRWNFFEEENVSRAGANSVCPEGEVENTDLGAARRKIIDISAQGSIVTLLDNRGNVYALDGDQPWDDIDENAEKPDDDARTAVLKAAGKIDIVVELPTIAFVDDRFPGQAVINPKRIEYIALHYRRLSGKNKMIVAGDAEQPFTIPIEPEYPGSKNEEPTPPGTDKVTVFRGRRIRNVSADCKQDYDTDLDFTVTITHSGVEPWELLRTETEVDIGKHRREKEREIHRAARIKP